MGARNLHYEPVIASEREQQVRRGAGWAAAAVSTLVAILIAGTELRGTQLLPLWAFVSLPALGFGAAAGGVFLSEQQFASKAAPFRRTTVYAITGWASLAIAIGLVTFVNRGVAVLCIPLFFSATTLAIVSTATGNGTGLGGCLLALIMVLAVLLVVSILNLGMP